MTDIHVLRDLILWVRDRVRERWTRRPSIHNARSEFRRIYPEAEIGRIEIWEDVKTARSYQVNYRRPGSTVEKQIRIQFMLEAQQWVVKPPLPTELP
jgi:hypothetical protein